MGSIEGSVGFFLIRVGIGSLSPWNSQETLLEGVGGGYIFRRLCFSQKREGQIRFQIFHFKIIFMPKLCCLLYIYTHTYIHTHTYIFFYILLLLLFWLSLNIKFMRHIYIAAYNCSLFILIAV